MKRSTGTSLGLALVVLSWGMNYVITKVGVTRLPTIDYVFWRFLGTTLIALPWMIRHYPRTRRDVMGLILMGLVGISLYQWLFTSALHLTLPANVAVIFCLSPLLTLLWKRLVGGKATGPKMWWGALLSLGGVALLAGASIHGGYLGDLFALAAAAGWSAFALMTDYLKVSVRGLAQVGWISLVGTIGVLPFMSYRPVWKMGASTWLPLIYAIVIVTVISLSLWQNAVEVAGAPRASLLLYIVPLVAGVAGWVFLGERLHWSQVIGACAILLGVAWADGRLHKRRGPELTQSEKLASP